MNKNIRYISILLILILSGLVISFTFPIKFLINFTHDDSFYYLKIADNLSKGFGSTFDQVNVTNGYHPLWLLALSVLFYVCNFIWDLNSDILFRIVFFVHILLCILTTEFVFRVFDKQIGKGRGFVKISFLFFAMVFIYIRDVGMESQIVCFLFSVYSYYKYISILEKSKNLSKRIFILLLITLARTDFIYSFIPTIIFFDLLTEKYNYKISIKLTFIILPFFVVGLFHLYNFIVFGNPNIISGYLVSSFPEFQLFNNLHSFVKPEVLFNQAVRTLMILAFVITILLLVYMKKIRLELSEYYLLGISLGSIIFIIIHLFFNRIGIREWYLTFPLFILGILLSSIINKFRFMNKYYIIMLGICFMVIFYSTRILNSKYDNIYDYSLKIRNTLPQDEKIFSLEWMGIIGFFSERKFICGDGFVNSFEYLDYIKKGNLDLYLKKYDITYYSTNTKSKIDLNKECFVDMKYDKFYNIDKIKFPTENILISEKYYYFHTAKKDSGYHYLIRFPEL